MSKVISEYRALIHPPASSVPAPSEPYTTIQDQAFLTFHDYGAPLLPNPTRRLVLRALGRITSEHGGDSREELGREVGYVLKSYLGGGSLRFWVKPEANMTWGMFATLTIGVTRFLERWDNVEFAVDMAMRADVSGKVGTAYLSRV